MNKNSLIIILTLAVLILGGVLAYPYLKPRPQTTGEKIDAALNDLAVGMDKASDAISGK